MSLHSYCAELENGSFQSIPFIIYTMYQLKKLFPHYCFPDHFKMIVSRTASLQVVAGGAVPNLGYTVVQWYNYHSVEKGLTQNTI